MTAPDRMFELIKNLSQQSGHPPLVNCSVQAMRKGSGFAKAITGEREYALQDSEDRVAFAGVSCIARLMPLRDQMGLTLFGARDPEEAVRLDYIGAGGAKRSAARVAQPIGTFQNAGVATGLGMANRNALAIALVEDEYRDRPEVAKFRISVHLCCQADALTRGATDKIDRRTVRAACLDNQEALV
jgi:hypothetical protein